MDIAHSQTSQPNPHIPTYTRASIIRANALKKMLEPHESLIFLKGLPLVVRPNTPDIAVATSCLSGEFDCLKYALPNDFRGVIIDAGGYIGTSAIALRLMYPQASIKVIEPSIDNLKILKKNLVGIPDIEIIEGALVGRQIGSAFLKNRGTGEWGYSIVDRPNDCVDAAALHATDTFMVSDLVDDIESIGIMKLDIEGGERELLLNDGDTLQRIPFILAELHERIAKGCNLSFTEFSRDRILIKSSGEKYLSIGQSALYGRH